MEHLLLKASVTAATDQGEFTAVISSINIDRDGDIVEPAGLVAALQKWAQIGKLMPLAWNHTKEIVGHINPGSATVQDGEVVTSGYVDQSTPRGQETWRLVKSGTLSFSYGMMFNTKTGARKRDGGGWHITQPDLYEVSVVPVAPANNDTRVLSYKTAEELREETDRVEREVEESGFGDLVPEQEPVADDINVKARIEETQEARAALELFEPDEITGLKAGILKAVWSAMMMNDLPDTAFLYVEAGGTKDADGKTTPRNLRHFPYKGPDGTVDLPHLRNALARIPQSNLPQDVKDRLTVKAQRILDSSKSVDVTDKEPETVRSVDPLRRQADATELEFLSDGLPRKSPTKVKQPVPEPELELKQLKQRMRDEILTHLSGDIT